MPPAPAPHGQHFVWTAPAAPDGGFDLCTGRARISGAAALAHPLWARRGLGVYRPETMVVFTPEANRAALADQAGCWHGNCARTRPPLRRVRAEARHVGMGLGARMVAAMARITAPPDVALSGGQGLAGGASVPAARMAVAGLDLRCLTAVRTGFAAMVPG